MTLTFIVLAFLLAVSLPAGFLAGLYRSYQHDVKPHPETGTVFWAYAMTMGISLAFTAPWFLANRRNQAFSEAGWLLGAFALSAVAGVLSFAQGLFRFLSGTVQNPASVSFLESVSTLSAIVFIIMGMVFFFRRKTLSPNFSAALGHMMKGVVSAVLGIGAMLVIGLGLFLVYPALMSSEAQSLSGEAAQRGLLLASIGLGLANILGPLWAYHHTRYVSFLNTWMYRN